MISEVISIRTWISTASVVASLAVLTVPGTAQLLEEPEVTGDVPETGFVLPEYETPREIIFEFALPFLLIAFILNIGLKQALFTTTVEPDENLGQTLMNELIGESSSRAATASRRARILSLVITGMLVPTKIFQLVNNFVSLVFGSVFFIVILAAAGLFLYTLFRSVFA